MTQIIHIPLKYSNAYLLEDEYPILIDTGSPGDTDALVAALREAGLAPQDLALILHTHAHYDHCGCSYDLKQLSDAPIAIHKMDKDIFEAGENAPIIPFGLTAHVIGPVLARKRYQGIKADILVEEGFDLTPYGVRAKIITTPGHTPGSISIMTDAREAIIGDLLMGGYAGGTFLPHRPNYHYFVHDLSAVHTSLRQVLEFSPRRIYVGHGGPLAGDVVQQFWDNIR